MYRDEARGRFGDVRGRVESGLTLSTEGTGRGVDQTVTQVT